MKTSSRLHKKAVYDPLCQQTLEAILKRELMTKGKENMFSITEELWNSRWSCCHEIHGRHLYLCRVYSESLAYRLIDKERYQLYKWHPDYIILRFPELCLFDLSNPRPHFSKLSGSQLLELWERAREIISEVVSNMGCILITGENLQSALYVCGPCMSTLNKLYRQFISVLTVGHRYMVEIENDLNSLSDLGERQFQQGYPYDFVQSIRNDYAQHLGTGALLWSPLGRGTWRHVELPIKNWLAGLNCNVGFILHAGLPFMVDYLMSIRGSINHVFVVEFHLENDPYELLKKKTSDTWFYPRENVGDRYVIVDKAFSGGTLMKAKQALPANTLTVALYPKSYSAITRADYCLFGGKLFSQASISKLDIERNNWSQILTLLRNGDVRL